MMVMPGQKLTQKELKAAMETMDGDGSNEVDFDEFYEWFTSDKSSAIKKETSNQVYEIIPHDY